jgi:hypothetical protein
MLQNLISFIFFYFLFLDQELSFELETTLFRLKEKLIIQPPLLATSVAPLQQLQ